MTDTTKEPWEMERHPGYPTVIYGRSSKELICEVDAANPNELALIVAASTLLIAAKGALAALSQNKTHPADIAAAKKWLGEAIAEAEGKSP